MHPITESSREFLFVSDGSFLGCRAHGRNRQAVRRKFVVHSVNNEMSSDSSGEALHQSLQHALESGGLEAWTHFVREAQGVMASAVFRALSKGGYPRKEEIEDLVQESFVKLCANSSSGRSELLRGNSART
jgi:hypothetical protein